MVPYSKVIAAIPSAQPRAEQGDYYNAVSAVLDAPVKGTPDTSNAIVAVIEAETGVGKALGYLAPAALMVAHAKAKGEQARVIIATNTKALRTQIMDNEAGRVATMVQTLTGQTITIRPFYALTSFISQRQLQVWIDQMEDDRRPADAARLRAWQDHNVFEDGLAAGCVLPEDLVPSDICMGEWSNASEKRVYSQMKALALEADIIVTTHAMICIDALCRGSIFEPFGAKTLIIDEGHKVVDAAQGVLVYEQRLRDPRLTTRLAAPIINVAGAILSAMKVQNRFVQIDPNDPLHAQLLDECEKVRGLDEFEGIARFIKAARNPNGPVKAYLAAAQTSDKPLLIASSYAPSRVLLRYFVPTDTRPRLFDRVIFTGDTLHPFLVKELKLDKVWDHLLCRYDTTAIRPNAFGSHEYVLCIGDSVPDPMISHNVTVGTQTETEKAVNPAYYDHVAAVIEQAHAAALAEKGTSRRTLVLVPSYEDVRQLGIILGWRSDFIFHDQTTLLSSVLDMFKAKHDAVLVTPAAWEGVDLPGMIQHLVIGRIPFEPPNVAKYLSGQRWVSVLNSEERAYAKLKQGLGRPIRSPSDSATIWIADKRFPPTAHHKSTYLGLTTSSKAGLIKGIPHRFRVSRGLSLSALDEASVRGAGAAPVLPMPPPAMVTLRQALSP